MAYINSTRTFVGGVGTDIAIAGAGNLFTVSGSLGGTKSLTLSDGFINNGAPEANLIVPLLFPNGHNDLGPSLHLEITVAGVTNPIPVVSNQNGTLLPIPHHEMIEGGSTVYKVVDPNTILNVYYTADYDGSQNPAFVIVGNPLVLSSSTYSIYANAQFKDGVCGDIKACYSATIPYGWLLCDGSDCSSYLNLCSFLGTTTLPDLRECVLVGAGQSSNDYDVTTNPNGIHEHDVYTVGEFKDDQLQRVYGKLIGTTYPAPAGWGNDWQGVFKRLNTFWNGSDSNDVKPVVMYNADFDSTRATRSGWETDPNDSNKQIKIGSDTTHGKQIGVNWIIKW